MLPLFTFKLKFESLNHLFSTFLRHAQVSQFRTDLSLIDLNGKEVMRKTISVNDPLRYGGLTIYQTDWGFSALQVSKNGEGPFNLAVAPLQMNGDKKLYGTFLPVGDTNSPNLKGMYVCRLTTSKFTYQTISGILIRKFLTLFFLKISDQCLLVIYSQFSYMIKKENLQEYAVLAQNFQLTLMV